MITGHVTALSHPEDQDFIDRIIGEQAGHPGALLGILDDVASRHACAVRAYCFMPDHLHVILRGTTPEADIWAAMVDLKQRTGLWLAANAGARWQKDFYDEILRSYEQAQDMISYVLRTR